MQTPISCASKYMLMKSNGGLIFYVLSVIKSKKKYMQGHSKAPLNTKLTLMDCGFGNTNSLGSSSSGLEYDCFYMKSTDGATMYFNLGSGNASGRFQTDY